DGIYDYDCVAAPPKDVAAQVLTRITATVQGLPQGAKGIRVHASRNSQEALISPHDSPVPRQRLPRERACQPPSSTALALAVPACGPGSSLCMGQDARWNLNGGRAQGVAPPQAAPEAGLHCGARGYCVSTVGLDEAASM